MRRERVSQAATPEGLGRRGGCSSPPWASPSRQGSSRTGSSSPEPLTLKRPGPYSVVVVAVVYLDEGPDTMSQAVTGSDRTTAGPLAGDRPRPCCGC